MKQQDKTNILINLLKKEENIEKIIEFIYKNLYQLINEIPYIENVTYFEFEKNYIIFFKKNIEENAFFRSLFIPFTRLSLSKLYKGIVCKLIFFSAEELIPLYLYNEKDNWLISFFIYKKIENNNVLYKKKMANFIVIENLTEVNIRDNMEEKGSLYNMKLILYKRNLKNNKIIIPNIKHYLYNENLYDIHFTNYKKKFNNQTEQQEKIKKKQQQENLLTTQEYSFLGYDNQLYNQYYAFLRSFKKNEI
jgi:hypothetical protein